MGKQKRKLLRKRKKNSFLQTIQNLAALRFLIRSIFLLRRNQRKNLWLHQNKIRSRPRKSVSVSRRVTMLVVIRIKLINKEAKVVKVDKRNHTTDVNLRVKTSKKELLSLN